MQETDEDRRKQQERENQQFAEWGTSGSWNRETEEEKWERYMDQKWNFEVGDVVKLKKPHPAEAMSGKFCG